MACFVNRQLLPKVARAGQRIAPGIRFYSATAAPPADSIPKVKASIIVERFPLVLRYPQKWELDWFYRQKELQAGRQKLQEEAEDKRLDEVLAFRKIAKTKSQEKKLKKAGLDDASIKASDAKKAPSLGEQIDNMPENFRIWYMSPQEILDSRNPAEEVQDLRTPEENDLKSLYRALDRRLYLLIKKPGSELWQFPMGDYKPEDGKALRATAERHYAEEIGSSMKVHFIGHCPMGHMPYPYDHKPKHDRNVQRIFYFKASHISGQVEIDHKEIEDFVWVTTDKLAKYLDPKLARYCVDMLPR